MTARREFDNDGLYALHLLRREAEDTHEAEREERKERRAHAALGLSRTVGEFSRGRGDDLNLRELMHRVRTEPPGPFTRTPHSYND